MQYKSFNAAVTLSRLLFFDYMCIFNVNFVIYVQSIVVSVLNTFSSLTVALGHQPTVDKIFKNGSQT